jgi:diguanylate cyclase (GGDEF)-like protein
MQQELSMNEKSGAEALGSGYYWVGSKMLTDNLQCNPYLFIEGEEAVLFDPGSVLDVGEVVENIASLVSLDKVKYVVLHNQDPDLASAVPRLEALGMHFTIVTHWRAWSLIRFYGITSPSYLVDEHEYVLTLKSGKTLSFIPTPYLHFPGAIVSYDKNAKFLLSSDLFGAFSSAWSLYAGDDYIEGMNMFHEYYMPSHEILGPVMQFFSGLDIAAILPHHGSIIDKDIAKYISALANLECGTLAKPFKKRTGDRTGEYGLPVERPATCDSLLLESQENSENLSAEISRLKKLNDELSQSAGYAQDIILKDAVTGLHNETYYRNFIDEEASIRINSEGVGDHILAVIGIDEGMARIEYQYGPREVESILKGIARIINETKGAGFPAFRLHGATFAIWMPQISLDEANRICDGIRTRVEISKTFIEPVTISIGFVAISEISESVEDIVEAGAMLTEIGLRRLRLARKRGGNTICSASEVGKEVELKARVLIVDDDPVNADVVGTFLENADYAVSKAADGDEALKKIEEEGYDFIISELMIPKIDGFMLKESLTRRSGTKDIPFILLSHLKDEKSVIRAYKLGVDYYLKKPFLLAELLGIVQKMTAAGVVR